MSNVIHFADPRAARRRMREQASAWLARLDAGASEAELEALGRWLDEDPAHLPLLLEMASLWDELGVLAELSEMFPLKRAAPRVAPRRRLLLAGAAAFAVAALGLAFVAYRPETGAPAPRTAATTPLIFETRVGEQATHVLADGSQVILNTASLIEVSFGAGERRVVLRRGEGHFTVAKDPARPFRVLAGTTVVEAVGTAFAVQRGDSEAMEVTVTEGRVNVLPLAAATAPSAPVELMAGERGTIDATGAAVAKEALPAMEIEASLAWRHGMLLFQDDSLEEVLREFSRYTPVRIDADPSVRDIQVNGLLPAGDIEQLMAHLRDNLNIQVRQLSADHIVLTAL